MILAKRPIWKLTGTIGLGLMLGVSSTAAYSQSEPSPSDSLGAPDQLRREPLNGVVRPPAMPSGGEAVPIPTLSAVAEPTAVPNASASGPSSIVRATKDDPAKKDGSTDSGKTLVADSSDPTSRQLQAIVIQAIDQLDASRLPQRQESLARVRAAIVNLEAYINLSSPNGQAWSQFLKLDELKRELSAERPQIDRLVELELNMRQNYLGLEYAPYQELRRGIGELVRALRYGSQPERTIEVLDGKLRQLVEDLSEPVTGMASDRALEVGLIANYLYEMNQAPAALARLRQQYSSPNVQVYVSESLVNRLLTRSVAEPSPVNECLLGTHIVGQACMLGTLHADLLPMSSGVSILLNLNANLTTQSQGYNRGVVIGSTSYSPVNASKQIFVNRSGISATPAIVATNLQTSINSIDHRLRIVRRIASRKAAEQKPLADAIAEGRMQNRVRSQYDQQVDQQLNTARVRLASLQNEARPELERLGIPKPQLHYNSTSDAIYGNLHQAAGFQLAARVPSGLARPQTADIFAEIHQSAVVNALDIALGERTIRSADLDDYAMQLTGSVSEEIQNEVAGEPWSIALAAYRPVDLQLDDGQITIKLRIVRMTRGPQSLDDSAIVTAVYKPTYSNGVVILDRVGPVDVSFTRASRGLRVVTLRSFLKGKFDTFFKEQVVTKRLSEMSLPAEVPHFDVDTLLIDNGWAQVGLR